MASQGWKEGPLEILWAKLLRFQAGKLRPQEGEGMGLYTIVDFTGYGDDDAGALSHPGSNPGLHHCKWTV